LSTSEIRLHPAFAKRLVALAEEMERDGHVRFAAEVYEIAAAVLPRGDEYRERAAWLRENADATDDPDREYKRRNLEASYAVGMARVFEARGEMVRAKEMFDLAKLRAPYHYLAYAGGGFLQLRRHDLPAALEEYVQARRLNPLDRKLAIESARVALELEDYPEALHHAVDAVLLSQGLGEADEAGARRRVETLGTLCRMTEAELSELFRQRAAVLQRAAERVALTRARLFPTLGIGTGRAAGPARTQVRQNLLPVAVDLRRFKVFRHFSDAQLVVLAQTGRRETFRHAQAVIREGQEERDLFVVLEGSLQTSRETPIGNQSLGLATTGDIFGEISFVDRKTRSASVMGIEGGSLLRLPAAEIDRVAEHDLELGVGLLWTFWHSLAGKVRGANGTMTELITPGVAVVPRAAAGPGERVHLDPAVKVDLLKEQGLSAAELRLLATYSQEERFAPEAMIFSEGQQGDKLYIVVEGQARISRSLTGMGEEALSILGRGEVFGEMALIDNEPRSADARAHTAGCTVFTIDRQRLEEVLDMDPDAARQFLGLLCQLLCRRLRAMNDRLVAWRVMAGHE
jgi:CRP/FNR family transcriptional regulator, cyclic AMP receptor protein